MRLFLAFLVAVALSLGVSSGAVTAAGFAHVSDPPLVAPLGEGAADDGGADAADVQLMVLGIAVGVVFVLLPLGYVLRRRLGRTAYTPPADGH